MLQLWQATQDWCLNKTLRAPGEETDSLQQAPGTAQSRGSNGACPLDSRNLQSLIIRKMKRNETKI